ncbi:MAG TPA: NAD(P)/FAD-dependent oxidoreductase [Gemmatimonadaceae bacterium]|nr:NAD(P)/FAD-dependent oxidoreductase [Gemmatimonadaceae bacterium]
MSTGVPSECDVAIVGAGAAGLAAMRALEEKGIRTCVLEARERIGGRIHTVRDDRVPHPIELGAEFVHGSAPELLQIVRDARLLASLVEGKRLRKRGDRLVAVDDFWKELHKVFRHLDDKGPDRSFAEFLDDSPGGRGAAEARVLARQFVQGFHAADVTRASAHALAHGGSPSEDEDEQRMLRVDSGYDRIAEWLSRGYAHRIRLRTVVEQVRWERGAAELTARSQGAAATTTVNARAVVVTVPLGVLIADWGETGRIEFDPRLEVIAETRRRLTMGSVRRVTMLFRERWWTKRLAAAPKNASLEAMSFLHGDAGDITVWWTSHPSYLPMVVGWAGGPAATRLGGLAPDEMQDRAVKSLAANLGVSSRRVESQLEAFWTHDWERDPFSRGAYSYALVGGAKWAGRLARPIAKTIWLAGEAADVEVRTGTVHGAIGSGRRAAKEIARMMK